MRFYKHYAYSLLLLVIVDNIYIYFTDGGFNSLYIASVLILTGMVTKFQKALNDKGSTHIVDAEGQEIINN